MRICENGSLETWQGGMLQHAAMRCSVLQCVAVCCGLLLRKPGKAVYYSVLQCAAVCCSMLQCGAVF